MFCSSLAQSSTNINRFTIQPVNQILHKPVSAFYHDDYHGGDEVRRNTPKSVENIICTLKNQFKDKSQSLLETTSLFLAEILMEDLPKILQVTGKEALTVCVIPRAKKETDYNSNQRLFKTTVCRVIEQSTHFHNGTNYITRHTNTRTTHMDRSGYGGDGARPYPGITKETCTISPEVKNKDILLIDDLYTKTVNIDEDAIQALFDMGANSVTFYAVGKTISRF